MQSVQKSDWLSIGQLILGGLGCLINLILAAILLLVGAGMLASGNAVTEEYTPLFLLAGLAVLIGLINIPSIVLAIRRLKNTPIGPVKDTNTYHLASLSMLAMLPLLVGGYGISHSNLAWAFLPWINGAALLIPIWWMVELGRRHLPSGSPQRAWGLVSASVTIVPLAVMLVEIVFMVIIIAAVLGLLSVDPVWMDKFRQLYSHINQADFDQQFLMGFLQDLLLSPLALAVLFLTIGAIMPLAEELLKPMGLWVLSRQQLTPAEGFSAGLFCGAGFALIESTALVAQVGESNWTQAVLLRIITSLLHITASAFIGWGLASWWQHKRPKFFLLSLLAAAGVHGIWNSLAILTTIASIVPGLNNTFNLLFSSTSDLILMMVSILVLLIVALLVMNRRLQLESAIPPPGQDNQPPQPVL